MMPYLIDADDRRDAGLLRQETRPDHLAFLAEHEAMLLAAGAKLTDDGSAVYGSFYIVDTEDRSAAEAFIAADPYSRAGLFERPVIERWRKAFFDFRRQPASGS